MNGEETDARTPSTPEPKRVYRTPRLVVHGKLEEITATGAGGLSDNFGGSL
jgi:hypothetical protein